MDFLTYAQAVGEAPVGSPAFVAGIDYDGTDPDEVEVVRLASEGHRYDRLRKLEEENASLRAKVAAFEAAPKTVGPCRGCERAGFPALTFECETCDWGDPVEY